MINPAYYRRGNIQCYDLIVDWCLGYELATVVKYLMRSEHKGNRIDNLKKAYWFLKAAADRGSNLMAGGLLGVGTKYTVDDVQTAWSLPLAEWSALVSIAAFRAEGWLEHLEDAKGIIQEAIININEADQVAVCDV